MITNPSLAREATMPPLWRTSLCAPQSSRSQPATRIGTPMPGWPLPKWEAIQEVCLYNRSLLVNTIILLLISFCKIIFRMIFEIRLKIQISTLPQGLDESIHYSVLNKGKSKSDHNIQLKQRADIKSSSRKCCTNHAPDPAAEGYFTSRYFDMFDIYLCLFHLENAAL